MTISTNQLKKEIAKQLSEDYSQEHLAKMVKMGSFNDLIAANREVVKELSENGEDLSSCAEYVIESDLTSFFED